ncbi:LysE/ArgO family amino acid transporter [Amaricoccus solimangrovi]|uniref:Amino acid transporter n=1 Tax=Amaricoccus solimangrovi TaxID=2589815 RepID=A0A501WCE7_9RHOB|nr:LysE/ArgO family amino acid transporter [Amaricoccus solimangrovi]TPE45754.1 amino acid transporter [Amaricoccus solimangrovi]
MSGPVFIAGMMMSLSLIAAIGAQNAFVLRQGLRDQHLFAVCLTCALSDALLITLGVTSFAKVAELLPWLGPAMRFGGAAFLFCYGAKSLRSALRSTGALVADGAMEKRALSKTLMACLAITFLNPHVYLDTVVLLGSVSARFEGSKLTFAAGAISASFLFFFGLGYGAIRLRPLFAQPLAWRALEGMMALVMWSIALRIVAA